MELVEVGRSRAPAAVVAHGAGSTADFVVRAFAGPLIAAGLRLVTWQQRGVGVDPAGRLAELDSAARRSGAVVVGGVSLGAHLATSWAAGAAELAGLLVVMPAWTGPAESVAALSAAAADELVRDGMPAVLARQARTATGWVAEELARAWPRYGRQNLVAAMRAVATSSAPDRAELAATDVPAGVVGLRDDPFHPVAVARDWTAALPRAALVELSMRAPGSDRAVLGRSAITAWRRAAAGWASGPR